VKTRCCDIVASFGRILRGKAPADRPIQFFSGLLGMTDEEYSILGMDGRSLPLLAEARRTGRDLRAAVAEHVATMRANPTYEDGAAVYALTHWVGRNPAR